MYIAGKTRASDYYTLSNLSLSPSFPPLEENLARLGGNYSRGEIEVPRLCIRSLGHHRIVSGNIDPVDKITCL